MMTTEQDSTTAPRGTPAGITKQAFEEIAEGWDGCQYDMVGDIGAALRRDFERLAAPALPSPAGGARLSEELITKVGLSLRIQAFENAKFRANEGAAMTESERDEFDQQVEFAHAIWGLAASVVQAKAKRSRAQRQVLATSRDRDARDG